MKRRLLKCLLAAACSVLAACAVITVNVYFPEKAAKEAYKSLDEMLLKAPGDKGTPGTPTGEPAPPAPAPGQQAQPDKPQSRLFDEIPSFSLVSEALAADVDADALAVELSSMPEVLKAYDEMNRRLSRLNDLFASGAVGLTNQGLVSVRDKAKLAAQDESLLAAENQSRKTVVTSMAKAIVKLNKQKESKAALDQVMGKAAATYADTKREAAQPGWWVQLQNGRWVQK
ncbi:lipoprotein [Geomonas silvestris]|uniref:Lipoprotein n=1 Tax=Geomonas silvestris TaxID=2740184 RepID=A0A6V8MEW3_9BACT|nr:DUF1318 domain-containing protein [Geomonas silvestris]GFO58536.1 lipoprotein [Geomonas silvestris]